MSRPVLVTGANRGIGLAIVRRLLDQADDTHVFLGARDAKRGQAARADVLTDAPEHGDRLVVLPLDVTSDASVQAAVEAVADQTGRLYGLINNAGIGRGPMEQVLEVNTRGPHRVTEAFLPLVDARIVNVASAAGPSFVADCSPEVQERFTDPDVTWDDIEGLMKECLSIVEWDGDFASRGFGGGDAYGLSKALLNAYTVALARENPDLVVNACTPGFIETDMTRPMAAKQDTSPEEMGMKAPAHGAKTPVFLMLGDPGGTGWYFGSDQERSPLDRYRSPGDPPYTGD